jgi:hypothetical protein
VGVSNKGDSDLDMSDWFLRAGDKQFVFPKHTIVGAHKTATFAQETTGLVTPEGSAVTLLFPDGLPVPTQQDRPADKSISVSDSPSSVLAYAPHQQKQVVLPQETSTRLSGQTSLQKNVTKSSGQEASLARTPTETSGGPLPSEDAAWFWYAGVAFLAVCALGGIKMIQIQKTPADEFAIIEEKREDLW